VIWLSSMLVNDRDNRSTFRSLVLFQGKGAGLMSNDEKSKSNQPQDDRVKPARKLGHELPKFLQDGGFVMIFGAKPPLDVSKNVNSNDPFPL
jgi:hypothetical protein